MPTINVDKQALYEAVELDYTSKEDDNKFVEICFHFGIELEDETTELVGGEERRILKIDIPANRYDLLCQEGLTRALGVFKGKRKTPVYKIVPPASGKLQQLIVKPETKQIRPFVVAAILRNITFTQSSYDRFIDLQDKLHNNICRKRTLASMGTHDLDTIQGPFTYEALPPKDIKFVPLNKDVEMDGHQLMEHYDADKHLGKFLHIIRDSPVYPVVYDANRVVCSLPPIINSEHSKIKLTTKNVFIEITATDRNKAMIVLNILTTMFSEYCEEQFTIEPVEVVNADNTVEVTPNMERSVSADINYINDCTGLDLSGDDICKLLGQMTLDASVNAEKKTEINVKVPPTRWDMLHACDVMEDVAIAYGYTNLIHHTPGVNTVASALPVNKLSDHMRREIALAGFTEVAPLILCSHDENFKFLNLKAENVEKKAIELANPKTIEYQVVRTSLLPGVLKTVSWNKKLALPIKVFEVSDIGFKDDTRERRARNERRVCVTYSSKTSGFEVIHGLLDRLMAMLITPRIKEEDKTKLGYWLQPSEVPTYFPGRSADIHLRYNDAEANEKKEIVIGSFGILHPTVLSNFEISYPTTALEFNLEPFV